MSDTVWTGSNNLEILYQGIYMSAICTAIVTCDGFQRFIPLKAMRASFVANRWKPSQVTIAMHIALVLILCITSTQFVPLFSSQRKLQLVISINLQTYTNWTTTLLHTTHNLPHPAVLQSSTPHQPTTAQRSVSFHFHPLSNSSLATLLFQRIYALRR